MGELTTRRPRTPVPLLFRAHAPRRLAQRGTAAAVLFAFLAVALPSTVSAAEPAFGTPTASATFQVGIDVTEPVTLPAGVRRVDVLVRTGKGGQTFVEEIDLPPAG
ncbi:MAG TPA: hypothetical protein VEX41_04115, partial [Candidatus Eisenbacteria bacterium]|nr:hypothetical protein [Candidatus Eisenbacteria bacterium]